MNEHGLGSSPPPRFSPVRARRRALVTGGAGFIGSCLATHLLRQGADVTILDNFSRPGSEYRAQALQCLGSSAVLRLVRGDVRNPDLTRQLAADRTEIYHFAAQVAVTQAIENPRLDFETNLAGTFNLLEAARANSQLQLFLFTSTNKVYGSLDDLALPGGACAESQPLDFHSPYGCSKGGADQYVHDYARIYRMPTVVFRMSCIYGPHQFGTEDQGWVAHFARAALGGHPVTVFGDGHQVRDLLFVDDLVAAIDAAWRQRARVSGGVFNLGGGAANTRSLLELARDLEHLTHHALRIRFAPRRRGDQQCYISDYAHFQSLTGWSPQTPVAEGLAELCRWLDAHRVQWEDEGALSLPLAS